jgi:hypothetical protein
VVELRMESGPVSVSRLYRVGNNKAKWIWEAAILGKSWYYPSITWPDSKPSPSTYKLEGLPFFLTCSVPSLQVLTQCFACTSLVSHELCVDYAIDLDSIFEKLKGVSKETKVKLDFRHWSLVPKFLVSVLRFCPDCF